ETLLRIDGDRNGEIHSEEFIESSPRLQSLVANSLEVRTDAGVEVPSNVEVELGDDDLIIVTMSIASKAGAELSLQSGVIGRLPPGHRQYVTLFNEDGVVLREQMLDAKNDTFRIAGVDPPRSFGEFLFLGVEHILTGYDHLVFLLGLLITGATVKSMAQIITSFTAAHSITLALATLDLVRLSTDVVEPLIAVSLIYIGVENIVRREARGRPLITFGFGLIHGFGFASILSSFGIGSSGAAAAALPLLSFNLGVEVGQIAVAALVLPLIWKLKNRPTLMPRLVAVCSTLVIVAGSLWLIERTLME
ncbi:MAG TPA: HupE/UreJ family protein, partial [Blastocatellia bacterium]|nr:HupE/UreJ family protein [Blastocatellia bacterium]